MAYPTEEERLAARKASTEKSLLKSREKRLVKLKAYNKTHKQKSVYNPEKRAVYNKTYYLKLNLSNKDMKKRTLKAWSIQVRERDTACLYCGSTNKLHAHHILSKVKHPEHALFLNNGITLCEVCHIQEHTINGDF